MIRVATVDDHEIVRDGLASRISGASDTLEMVASTDTVEALLDLMADGIEVDVVLLDLHLAAGPTYDAVPDLVDRGLRVLVYTTEERPVPLRRAVTQGASGVLLKSDAPPTVVAAIRDAHDGAFACSGPLAHALVKDEGLVADLSPRQVEILQLLDEGLDYRGVASVIGGSEGAVKTHLQRIREKFRRLGVEPGNAHHLTRLAGEQGHLD